METQLDRKNGWVNQKYSNEEKSWRDE